GVDFFGKAINKFNMTHNANNLADKHFTSDAPKLNLKPSRNQVLTAPLPDPILSLACLPDLTQNRCSAASSVGLALSAD
ncbi:MAG: hypothetical protein ACRDEA_11165, partial [Microcystaceae cyanobacterium]